MSKPSNQVYRNQENRYNLLNSTSNFYSTTIAQPIAISSNTIVTNWAPSAYIQDANMVTDSAGTFTFNVDGTYSVNFNVFWAANNVGSRVAEILYNEQSIGDINLSRVQQLNTGATDTPSQNVSAVFKARKGDTVRCVVFQNGVDPLDIIIPTSLLITRLA